jgi:hypothetical protein
MWRVLLFVFMLAFVFLLLAGRPPYTGRGEDRVQVVKLLGSGAVGSVYMVEKNGKPYALKREKILPEAKNTTHALDVWNALKDHAGAKYFARVYSNRTYKCARVRFHDLPEHLVGIKRANGQFRAWIRSLEKSPWCQDTLMELGGDTLARYMAEDIHARKPAQDRYRIVAQLLESVRAARACGVFVNDLHAGNIVLVAGPGESTAGPGESTAGRPLHIDYGEMKIVATADRSTFTLEHVKAFGDLFSVVRMCLRSDYVFINYTSKIDKKPTAVEIRQAIPAADWARVRPIVANILRDSLWLDLLETTPGPKWEWFIKYIDFTWWLVNPAANVEFWARYVSAYSAVRTLPEFVDHADLLALLENYWDIDGHIERFYGRARMVGGRKKELY